MNRKEFLKTCGFSCLAGLAGASLLQSCSSSQVLAKDIDGSDILVPLTDFEIKDNGTIKYKKYIIIQNEKLKYPICVYRFGVNNYSALLMQCTHQGTELQVFGDKLQCSAHGSEFSNKGSVENGPADRNLRNFPIKIDNNTLKISLK
ncbi:Rieske (2Fe-2S) protein [Flavobacterium ranwuense]|uniref:Rieske (2Fe-2S) protein n=1 Tax=Flavobacterium ranwuense TaxID=2541725 RepID=A0ABY2DRD6_9FLAO|nr:Rieske (2Fe-2S) protein [Flavobacterium ranwuense]TDE29339.1 Rieske (2Fe-2S) protein [Flavobacterium ranwuense]